QLCVEIIAKQLAGRLDPDNYLRVLNWLSYQHENGSQEKRRSVRNIFKRFLEQSWNLDEIKSRRGDVLLLNQNEQWRSPGELVSDYIGIDTTDLLDDELTPVLFPGGPQTAVAAPAWSEGAAPQEPFATVDFAEAARAIIDYFSQFESKVPRPL